MNSSWIEYTNWLNLSVGPLGMSPGGKLTLSVLIVLSILALGICLNRVFGILLRNENSTKEAAWDLLVLRWICTASPQLGILGTVLGIIDSFTSLGQLQVDTSLMLQGLGSALFTSAAGLAIAILYSLPYSYFKSRLEERSELQIGTES